MSDEAVLGSKALEVPSHSYDALDIPMEINTILPLVVLTFPFLSRGTIREAMASEARQTLWETPITLEWRCKIISM
jgi:hypothetical protein